MSLAMPVRTKRARFTLQVLRGTSRLEAIMGFNLDQVAEYIREMSRPDEDSLNRALGGYRRFLMMCLAGFDNLPASLRICQIWTAHATLHEDGYAALCEQVFGEHLPHSHPEGPAPQECSYFLERAYWHVFSLVLPDDIWGGPLTCQASNIPVWISGNRLSATTAQREGG